MRATLFSIPGSHPALAARLMLEHKAIPYRRIDLVPALSRGIVRAAGFDGDRVPAIRMDGRKIQGTREISRALDQLVPEPPLFPADPEKRARVEEAERWGDEVLQPVPRRVIWNVLSRDPRGRRSYLEGARLGVPIGLAVKTAAPLVAAAKRLNRADDEAVRRDLEALPGLVEHVNELLREGVIGTAELNAADFQIAPSVRLLMTMDDTRPYIEGRSAADYAMWLVPDFPGYAPAALPDSWKPSSGSSSSAASGPATSTR